VRDGSGDGGIVSRTVMPEHAQGTYVPDLGGSDGAPNNWLHLPCGGKPVFTQHKPTTSQGSPQLSGRVVCLAVSS